VRCLRRRRVETLVGRQNLEGNTDRSGGGTSSAHVAATGSRDDASYAFDGRRLCHGAVPCAYIAITMKARLARIGNSRGIRLPKAVVRAPPSEGR
jgi:hypothetical protein